MSRDDFEKRMARLGVRPDTVATPGGHFVAPRAVPKRAGLGHVLFGVLWGTALGFVAVYMNQNYDGLFRSEAAPPLWAMVAVGFLLASLAALALMVISGILYALVGRFGSRRWTVIFTTVVFVGAGAYLARAAIAAGY